MGFNVLRSFDGGPFFYMAFACCVNVYGDCAHEQHLRRTLTLNTNSHDHCLLSKWKCRTCAHTHLCS